MTFFSLAAPSASPANFTGSSTSSTSILVQWDQVPLPYQNGVILYYTVTYRLYYNGLFPQTMVVAAPTNQTTLTGLNQSTLYSIAVSASTRKGGGPFIYIYIATGKKNEFPSSLLDLETEITTMKKEKKTLSHYRKTKWEWANAQTIT